MPLHYGLANDISFDDRICHEADIEDLNLSLMKDFLREVNSELYKEVDELSFIQLCRQMQIIHGPSEYLKPRNIGLLMFHSNPEVFFPYARIEVVEFRDMSGDNFSEKIFKGPIHLQLREALRYIQAMFVKEEIRKRPDRAEADRFYNFPYLAIEEALANAVYHKDYAIREPIEVRLQADSIEVLSFPGPLPPLKIQDLNRGDATIRGYRNRRIGDILKELHLTEGRCTGVPKIRRAMKKNGSPPPIFQTDEENTYFLTRLLIHPELSPSKSDQYNKDRRPPKSIQSEPKVSSEDGKSTQSSSIKVPSVAVKKPIDPSESIQSKPKVPSERGKSTQSSVSQEQEKAFSLFSLKTSIERKIRELGSRPSKGQLRKVVQELCALHPFTANELCQLLGRKSRKAFVRDHLSPMIEERMLRYEALSLNSSQQAYVAQVMD